ncbi:MAG TPA: WbuC family cupin fold metalloprotein [Steroidobacteraceae bacterium]|nr:WbuC family cupin fold metalloprotein [Steroidobacteraceae bacterium]
MTGSPLKILSGKLLEELAAQAAASPRRRAHYNLHAAAGDPVQRFFVAACRDSYFRPHRHQSKSELALVLRGRFEVLLFDAAGAVIHRHAIGEGTPAFAWEVPRATWHTLLPDADGATFLEVKEGPYEPATAVEFAPWAPAEGDAAAVAYMEGLRGG